MKKGQILVETIIGIGVIAFVLAGIIPLFLIGIRGGAESWRTDSARLLAQEAMAATAALSRENWNILYRPLGTNNKGTSNPYHPVAGVNSWGLDAGSEQITINNITFNREIFVDNVSRTGTNGAGDLEKDYNLLRDDPSTQQITVKVSWPGSAGIELVNYLGRWQNSLWQQNDWSGGPGVTFWQEPPANAYFSRSQIYKPAGDIDTSFSGTLRLAKIPVAGTAKYGNQFVANTTTYIYSLNNANRRVSMRFTAAESGNVNQIRFYIDSQRNGNQVSFRYGIQTDDGSANHLPSGTFLAENTASLGATGWQTINLSSPGTLVAGNIYHLVVEWSGSGQTPSNNRYLNVRSSLPNNLIIPQNGHKDSAANTLRFDGTNWLALNQQPIYVLGFDDGTFAGNPYDTRASRNIFGGRFEGETLAVTTERKVSGVGLYVASSANNLPNDNLYVSLDDLTSNTKLVNAETLVDVATTNMGTGFSWEELNFASSITLPANHQFRLYFSSPGSSSNRNYLIANESNPNSAEYNDLNWDGTNSLSTRSTDSGGSFTDFNYIDLSYYLIVAATEAYVPSGELISASLDTGNQGGAGFNRLSWNLEGALPPNTTCKVQLAANNDNATWDWTGPNGPGTWYSTPLGENIWTGLYSASASQPPRYLRYKIRLETTDDTISPVVDWLRINWSQ